MKFWQKMLFFFSLLFLYSNVYAKNTHLLGTIDIADLPVEAQQTIVLIKKGGPFPYSKDGAVFGNYEGVLPRQKRGYYHEFTVRTPGARNRGARRIVVGGEMNSPREFYYTNNHYASFKRIKE